MKKLTWITGLLVFLTVIFAALGCICHVFRQTTLDTTLYYEQSRAAVKEAMGFQSEDEVTQYIGLTPEEQKHFAETAYLYMLGEEPWIDLPTYVSQDEARHMLDVRAMSLEAESLSKLFLALSALLAVAAAWTGAKIKRCVIPDFIGGASAVGMMLLAVKLLMTAIQSGRFGMLFVRLHEMFFDNDLWMMDPAEDIIIRMMPENLFEQAFFSGASEVLRMFLIMCAVLSVVHVIILGMVRRHAR